jgi:hypothetical protein
MNVSIDKVKLKQELITAGDLWKASWRNLFVLDTEAPATTWDLMLRDHTQAVPRYYELTLKDQIVFMKMQSRKQAVLSYDWRVDCEDDQIKDFCETMLKDREFNHRQLMSSLLDAVGYGFSVVENIWDVRDGKWIIARTIERPPTLFAFNKLLYPQVGELGILRPGTVEPDHHLPPYKFIVHTYQPDEGDRTGTPLLREVFWPVWIGRMAAKLMLRAGEKGSGTVDVKYSQPGDTKITTEAGETTIAAEAQRLAEAVANGTAVSHGDAYVVELVEKARQGDSSVFRDIVDWCERRITLVFTGEVLSSSGGDEGSGSYALGKVHQDVRQEIVNSDARDLETTLDSQVLAPVVRLNYGPSAPPARFVIETPLEEPAIESWHVQQGVVSVNEVRERLRLPAREGQDELVKSGTGVPPVGLPIGAQFSEQDDPWRFWLK